MPILTTLFGFRLSQHYHRRKFVCQISATRHSSSGCVSCKKRNSVYTCAVCAGSYMATSMHCLKFSYPKLRTQLPCLRHRSDFCQPLALLFLASQMLAQFPATTLPPYVLLKLLTKSNDVRLHAEILKGRNMNNNARDFRSQLLELQNFLTENKLDVV